MADHPTACAAWHEDVASWLVAQLTPDREAELTEHLRTCAACRSEADSLAGVAAMTLVAVSGRDVDRADVVPTGRPADGSGPPTDDQAVADDIGEHRPRRLVRSGLVALVAGSLLLAVVVASGRGGDQPEEGTPLEFSLAPPGAEATVVITEHDGASVVDLVASGLDPDLTYALWLSPPGGSLDERVPAGTFRPDEGGRVEARLACALPPDRSARAWATAPSGEVVLDTEPGGRYRE